MFVFQRISVRFFLISLSWESSAAFAVHEIDLPRALLRTLYEYTRKVPFWCCSLYNLPILFAPTQVSKKVACQTKISRLHLASSSTPPGQKRQSFSLICVQFNSQLRRKRFSWWRFVCWHATNPLHSGLFLTSTGSHQGLHEIVAIWATILKFSAAKSSPCTGLQSVVVLQVPRREHGCDTQEAESNLPISSTFEPVRPEGVNSEANRPCFTHLQLSLH